MTGDRRDVKFLFLLRFLFVFRFSSWLFGFLASWLLGFSAFWFMWRLVALAFRFSGLFGFLQLNNHDPLTPKEVPQKGVHACDVRGPIDCMCFK